MKPIIVNMQEMSDSTEVYESRPNPFFIYFIYVLAAFFLLAVVWMSFFKIDIVVKSNGMFRSEAAAVEVSSSVSGIITEWHISEGRYVEEGDLLFAVDAEALEATIADNQELLKDVDRRIEMLLAYDRYLDGEEDALEGYGDNPYYDEFQGRKQLLVLSAETADTDMDTQKSQYQKELENTNRLISQYEEQRSKLRMAEDGVKSRTNPFDSSESYYESIVSSYLSNYQVTQAEYDVQIAEYQRQIESCENQIAELEEGNLIQTQTAAADGAVPETMGPGLPPVPDTEPGVVASGLPPAPGTEQEDIALGAPATGTELMESLKRQITELQSSMRTVSGKKETVLKNLELQQITALEQQIENIENALNSAVSSQSLLSARLEVLNGVDTGQTEEMNILTEKQAVATELSVHQAKKTEYENLLKQYDMENGNATVTASASGYIYLNQELKNGSFIAQGTNVCRILPKHSENYYAEIYVENGDIAKLREGQEVKFEIAAYPSSEYGYFTGVVDTISKDIKVDSSSGSAYYLAKVRCQETTVTNRKGESGTIQNGMACQGKIVVDEESVLKVLLGKLDFLE